MIRKTRTALLTVLVLAALGPRPGHAASDPLKFSDLPGWTKGHQAEALQTFLESCPRIDDPAWQEACDAAPEASDPRRFFETYFHPVRVGAGKSTLFTGYYEPEIPASPVRTPHFAYPIYARPPELVRGRPWHTREEIESKGLLRGRGLEIAWLADPVEVFFLQIQGSGRLTMPDGRVERVGFAAKNGQPYRSVGREMIRRGLVAAHNVSARIIKAWVRHNPDAGRRLLWFNPSYIFFRKLNLPKDHGPLGAMQVPVTAGRSLAVDSRYVPLGAPVWVDIHGHHPMRRLMVAQDRGSAIKGPRRADVFIGSGAKAGRIAGRMRDRGHMYVLMPKALAVASAGEPAE